MTTLIDLWAPWCTPCKLMNPVIEELEKEFEGKVEFKKVNVDEEPDVASKYGVMSIPTFIIEKDSQEIGRKIGITAKKDLVALLNS